MPVRQLGNKHSSVRQIEFVKIMTKPADQPEQKIPSRIRIPIPDSNFLVQADMVTAIAAGRKAARGMDAYLQSLSG
ncbi:hypothetical protein hrd7_05170 [Leptolinea sp. HRD-7]|nr:hypothetical protein hrd7_05170 [Leptolinea sp. HRD-7]